MKKIYAVIAASLLAFSGCNVLDTKDLSNYGPDVWNDSKLTSAFLTDIYGNVLNLTWPRDGSNSDGMSGYYGKRCRTNRIIRRLSSGLMPVSVISIRC